MTTKITDDIDNQVEEPTAAKEPTAAEANGERQQQEGRIEQAQHTIKNALNRLLDRVRQLRSEQGAVTHTND
jgi:hypothetical protein